MARMFGLDLRRLALTAHLFGIVAPGRPVLRACDLEAHYSDAGILPRGMVDTTRWRLSLHMLSGSRGSRASFS